MSAACGRRYDSATIAEARRLASDGSWSAYGITGILNRRGIPVAEATVRRWIDTRDAERQRLAGRRRANAKRASRLGAPWMHSDATPEYKLARLVALSEAGLSNTAVAAVLRIDFDESIVGETVKTALETGRPPAIWWTRARRRAA